MGNYTDGTAVHVAGWGGCGGGVHAAGAVAMVGLQSLVAKMVGLEVGGVVSNLVPFL